MSLFKNLILLLTFPNFPGMHGGISERIQSLQQLRQLKRPATDYDAQRPCAELDLLWADPEQGIKGTVPSTRGWFFLIYFLNQFLPFNFAGASVMFGEDLVMRTLKQLDIDLIVRAHQVSQFYALFTNFKFPFKLQVVQDGAEFFADRRLITLFSAPHYAAQYNNAGATMSIAEDLQCAFHIFAPTDDGQLH